MHAFRGRARGQVISYLELLRDGRQAGARVAIVGAGGIGGTLFSAFQRFDYEFVCAIVLAIVAMIVLGEALARLIRRLLGIDAKAGSE